MAGLVGRVADALSLLNDLRGNPDWHQRAVGILLAIREPTDAMLEQGSRETEGIGEALATWRSMIDAAIKDGA